MLIKGSVGSKVLESLSKYDEVKEIVAFTRRSLPIKPPKVTEQIVNFDDIENCNHFN